jgi:hypothetical protein
MEIAVLRLTPGGFLSVSGSKAMLTPISQPIQPKIDDSCGQADWSLRRWRHQLGPFEELAAYAWAVDEKSTPHGAARPTKRLTPLKREESARWFYAKTQLHVSRAGHAVGLARRQRYKMSRLYEILFWAVFVR